MRLFVVDGHGLYRVLGGYVFDLLHRLAFHRYVGHIALHFIGLGAGGPGGGGRAKGGFHIPEVDGNAFFGWRNHIAQAKKEEQDQHHHMDADGPVQASPFVLLVTYHYFGSVANTILN